MISGIRQTKGKPHDETGINNRGKNMLSCEQGHYLPCPGKYIESEKRALWE